MIAVVIIAYRIKILIPEKLLWSDKKNITQGITRNLLGAKIDYVIHEIDRENSVCVASRIEACRIRKRQFFKGNPKVGEHIKCNILAVGMRKIFIEVGGFDLQIRRNELSYATFSDFRLHYCTGQILDAVITQVDKREDKLNVSVREAKPHPYIGLQKRHPINSRRTSVITGKYKGAIFCKLEDDFDCLCKYSAYQNDDEFNINDRVIIIVKEYDDAQKRAYGVIVSKWR